MMEVQTPDVRFLRCFSGRQWLTAREVGEQLRITAEAALDHACALCAKGLLRTYADDIPAHFQITPDGLDIVWPELQHAHRCSGIVEQATASRSLLELAWGS